MYICVYVCVFGRKSRFENKGMAAAVRSQRELGQRELGRGCEERKNKKQKERYSTGEKRRRMMSDNENHNVTTRKREKNW